MKKPNNNKHTQSRNQRKFQRKLRANIRHGYNPPKRRNPGSYYSVSASDMAMTMALTSAVIAKRGKR
ncbi:MAG: hypothetical protein KDK41_17715 [Leptospiraceae bacterium]|nr:hypothetical protein [Leptospiraceae bacterium]